MLLFTDKLNIFTVSASWLLPHMSRSAHRQ